MEEFLKQNYLQITFSVEFLAALTGVLMLRKYKDTHAKYLIYFLIYAFFVDLIGNYPRHLRNLDLFHLIEGTIIEKNYWWFAVFWFGGLTSFITILNFKILKTVSYKKILKYCFYTYVGLFFLYGVFNYEELFNPVEKFIKIMSLWMVFVSISLYLLEILQSDEIVLFYKSIYFYANISVLLWCLITGPMMFYEIYFSTADWSFIILKWQIFLTVNIFFYLTLTIALICCKPETKL